MSQLVIPSNSPSAYFPAEIEASLQQIRDQCGAIIEAVCGSGARAKDVADRFGVHAKLGWQLWNVAYSPPLTALRFLPNPHGIKAWRQSAAEKGVPEGLLARFEQATEDVRRVIETHAEDREMFEMLLDARNEEKDEEGELRWRKQAFTGNSYMFGARAKCMLATAVLYPSGKDDLFSIVRLHGLIDLVRTRGGVRWPFSRLVIEHDGDNIAPRREPLDWNSTTVPLLPDYCSKPLPAIERRSDGKMLYDELLPATVGLTGASTIFTGEILHEVGPASSLAPGQTAHFGTGVRTPSELLMHDHIVHRSLFPNAVRELRVYSELVSETSRDERDRLVVAEKLQHLGRGLDRVRTADVPNYAELLTEAFTRIDQDPADFDVFRIAMRYPPIPASAMVRFTLPDSPTT